ncbi:MAG: hypothetical protein Q8L88_06120 [Bacteroidota bacterium]|nr:hypothetical protein [Bacteroidota bacterium]
MVDQNFEQGSSDVINSVENALASLWDKAREASLLISTLREEKKRLLRKIDELEEDLKQSKNDAILQQAQIETMKMNAVSDTIQKNESIALDVNERRLIQQKLRNVISKLDQYLVP